MESRASDDGAGAKAAGRVGAAVASAHLTLHEQIVRAREGLTRGARQMVPPLRRVRGGGGFGGRASEADRVVTGPCLANISMATSSAATSTQGAGNTNNNNNGDGDDGVVDRGNGTNGSGDLVRRRRRRWMSGGRPGDSERGSAHAPRWSASGGVQFVSDGGGGGGGANDVGEDEEDAEGNNRPILISSIDFQGESPELEQLARGVVFMKPNFSYTIKDIAMDVARIFNTGWFKEVTPLSVDTRDGISLTFVLAANPVIRGVVLKGACQLPVSKIYEVFKPQFGKVLNSNHVLDGCNKLTEWYESQKMPTEYYGVDFSDGILEFSVDEPRIGEVEIRFLDSKTGEPTKGHTRPDMIHRHLKSIKPGMLLHARVMDDMNDLLNTSGLETANLTLSARKVDGNTWAG